MNSYNHSTAADRVFHMAHRFLRECGVRWLPVDIIGIAQGKWSFKWAHVLAKEIGQTNDHVCRHVCRSYDGAALYDQSADSYRIILNSEGVPQKRINWSCAHEVGHIYLGHLKDNGVPCLTAGTISPERYAQLEFEADLFAGEVLASKWLMRDIDIVEESDIAMICNISDPAALSRYRQATYEYRFVPTNAIVTRDAFKEYLTEITVCMSRTELADAAVGDVSRFAYQNKPKDKLPSPKPRIIRRLGNCPFYDSNYDVADSPNFCTECGSSLRIGAESNAEPCGYRNHKEAAFCAMCGNRVYRIRQGFCFEEYEI